MKINFKLAHIDEVGGWGTEGKLSMHWFGLTDGDLWIRLNGVNLYEYTNEAMDYFGGKRTPYCDYYIVRFIEDFTGLFQKISENIPEEIFELTENLKGFDHEAQKWLELNEIEEDTEEDFYFNEYLTLISWREDRMMDSNHLIAGPYISIFRHNDLIRFVWFTEAELENGIKIWKANDGHLDLSFNEFVKMIEEFGSEFFRIMSSQVDDAVRKEWGEVSLDKERLKEEHLERQADFYEKLLKLKSNVPNETDWDKILILYKRMKKEIGNKS